MADKALPAMPEQHCEATVRRVYRMIIRKAGSFFFDQTFEAANTAEIWRQIAYAAKLLEPSQVNSGQVYVIDDDDGIVVSIGVKAVMKWATATKSAAPRRPETPASGRAFQPTRSGTRVANQEFAG